MYKVKELNLTPKVKLSKYPLISEDSVIYDSDFGSFVQIGKANNIQESVIGDFSYTSEFCQIIYTNIQKFVNIASFVRINPGQHPMQWASQHHMLYRKEMFGFGEDDTSFFDWRRQKKVFVGNDVWIGHNVTIMGGVHIGNGAVIGSGAIVTKDIPAYAIAVGNPAKVIRYRFDAKTVDALQKIAWWDWEYETIKKHIESFKDIKSFIENAKVIA